MGNVSIGTPMWLDGRMNDRADVPREEKQEKFGSKEPRPTESRRHDKRKEA